jgi:hypothetical protein
LQPPLQFDEPFPAGVDGETSQIAHDPAAAQALGHSPVVPEPQKKSATISLGLLSQLVITSINSSFFSVAYSEIVPRVLTDDHKVLASL